MSLVIDNQLNFSLQVSPRDLSKFDALRWDEQQLTLVVDRTAIRPSDQATFLHGRVVTIPRDQQMQTLVQQIDELNFALGEQQKVIEDLKNIKVEPPKKAKRKLVDDS